MNRTKDHDIRRREFMTTTATAALGIASAGLISRAEGLAGESHAHSLDQLAVHGMLVFGERTVYLSHRPLFGTTTPHRYQVVLEVTLAQAGRDPQADFRAGSPPAPGHEVLYLRTRAVRPAGSELG